MEDYLTVGLISVLTDIVWRITVAWHAGNAACKIIRYLQGGGRACWWLSPGSSAPSFPSRSSSSTRSSRCKFVENIFNTEFLSNLKGIRTFEKNILVF
ncbi:Uncharacterized protein GBIM_13773 [Gryllus bimaculatus]|nr:Uncharacterized protein GBIM_13773 [Gryllus bimaculatus]